jgi:hypothetical protein
MHLASPLESIPVDMLGIYHISIGGTIHEEAFF